MIIASLPFTVSDPPWSRRHCWVCTRSCSQSRWCCPGWRLPRCTPCRASKGRGWSCRGFESRGWLASRGPKARIFVWIAVATLGPSGQRFRIIFISVQLSPKAATAGSASVMPLRTTARGPSLQSWKFKIPSPRFSQSGFLTSLLAPYFPHPTLVTYQKAMRSPYSTSW